MEARLRRRGTDSPAELDRRLGVARQEIAQWRNFQYLIISTSIAEDVRRMEAIIDAGTHAPKPRPNSPLEIEEIIKWEYCLPPISISG